MTEEKVTQRQHHHLVEGRLKTDVGTEKKRLSLANETQRTPLTNTKDWPKTEESWGERDKAITLRLGGVRVSVTEKD